MIYVAGILSFLFLVLALRGAIRFVTRTESKAENFARARDFLRGGK